MADTLLTIPETAAILKADVSTVYKWVKPGGPLHHAAVQLSDRAVRVRRADLEQYLAAGGANAAS